MSKVFIPEGMERIQYINDEIPLCHQCGAVLDRKENGEYCDILKCPNCGWTIDEMDYDFPDDEDEYDDIYGEDDSTPSKGCAACGGPYPECKTSCSLFDD